MCSSRSAVASAEKILGPLFFAALVNSTRGGDFAVSCKVDLMRTFLEMQLFLGRNRVHRCQQRIGGILIAVVVSIQCLLPVSSLITEIRCIIDEIPRHEEIKATRMVIIGFCLHCSERKACLLGFLLHEITNKKPRSKTF